MSCLFRSLSYYLKGIDERKLREQICNYLEENPPLMDDLKLDEILKSEGNATLDSYIQAMRNEATWGGAIEIKAFCEIFHVGIEVFVQSSQKSIYFYPSEPRTPPLFARIEWMGVHFEPKPYS